MLPGDYVRWVLVLLLSVATSSLAQSEETPVVDAGVLNCRARKLPPPVYPSTIKGVRVAGTVIVEVAVNEEGRVMTARAVSGHPLLQASCVAAAWQAEFVPLLYDGQKARMRGVLAYDFPYDWGQAETLPAAVVETRVRPGTELSDAARRRLAAQCSDIKLRTICGSIVNNKAVKLPVPTYPAAALKAGMQGRVEVIVIVDTEGKVASARAATGPPGLRGVAEAAASAAQFHPTLIDTDKPPKFAGALVYHFRITGRTGSTGP